MFETQTDRRPLNVNYSTIEQRPTLHNGENNIFFLKTPPPLGRALTFTIFTKKRQQQQTQNGATRTAFSSCAFSSRRGKNRFFFYTIKAAVR